MSEGKYVWRNASQALPEGCKYVVDRERLLRRFEYDAHNRCSGKSWRKRLGSKVGVFSLSQHVALAISTNLALNLGALAYTQKNDVSPNRAPLGTPSCTGDAELPVGDEVRPYYSNRGVRMM